MIHAAGGPECEVAVDYDILHRVMPETFECISWSIAHPQMFHSASLLCIMYWAVIMHYVLHSPISLNIVCASIPARAKRGKSLVNTHAHARTHV